MTPVERFNSDTEQSGFVKDETQLAVVKHFQELHDQLENETRKIRNPAKLFRRKKTDPVQGMYLWGGVGRGKTYLMDLFFDTAPMAEKTRMHFHRYMLSVHEELKILREVRDPLVQVAKRFARQNRLLCLDEFAVLEIGDAVILAGLLRLLMENGVTIVTTSNIEPDKLYEGGLQRDRFLPAIRLINQRMKVVQIGEGIDYRLRSLSQMTLYHHPLGTAAKEAMDYDFRRLHDGTELFSGPLTILNREIKTVRRTRNLVWFNFSEICDGPRSKADYVEIANCYRTVLISNIPEFTWELENQAHRFIQLVDEFYDHGVHLIVSAEKDAESLYSGKRFSKEFQRTASRLREMQTNAYLSRIHA